MDKDGNAIAGNTISKDNLVFKDALKNEISTTDADFLTKIKTVEFTVRYDTTTIPANFDISITANYVLDPSYTSTTDIAPNQSYTNSYTVVSKNITADTDYTYSPASGKDEGFVFATNLNSTIIKDGSGNSEIYGGKGVDTVYDGGGDDTISTDAGNDTIYGGAGVNTIDGGADTDTITYKNVSAYTISAPANSYETTIQDEFSGVYIDLAGFDANGDSINENAIGKYGSVLGYDTISNIEKVEGSDYNDRIYGDNNQNTLSGGVGSDTIDGRGGGDTVLGGGGYDTLYSGSGNDILNGGREGTAGIFLAQLFFKRPLAAGVAHDGLPTNQHPALAAVAMLHPAFMAQTAVSRAPAGRQRRIQARQIVRMNAPRQLSQHVGGHARQAKQGAQLFRTLQTTRSDPPITTQS
jgi:Ca2+-binding RTX toxin-like protein